MLQLTREHYEALLRELNEEREQAELALSDIENAISVVQKQLAKHNTSRRTQVTSAVPTQPGLPPVSLPPLYDTGHSSPGRFTGMSMRWAALWFLFDEREPVGTPIIAAALQRDGITSKSANFVSNVSAVLSAMRDRKEVSLSEGKWQITDVGRSAWEHINVRRASEPTYGIRNTVG